jgi:hypothetical protein
MKGTFKMTNTIGSHNKFGALAFIAIMGMVFSSTAFADSGSKLPINTPKAYAQECTACHIAYPPGMLPKQSWQRIMAGARQTLWNRCKSRRCYREAIEHMA